MCVEEFVTTEAFFNTGVCALVTPCLCFSLFKRESTSYKITC